MSASYRGIAFAVFPGFVMLALYYSLAIHMHRSLGGWPASIGERGFSPALAMHAAIAGNVCIAFFLSLWVVPIPLIACLLTERWQRFALYLALYAGAVFICFVLMQFAAPAQFLYWWKD